jgi:hypothetical protein
MLCVAVDTCLLVEVQSKQVHAMNTNHGHLAWQRTTNTDSRLTKPSSVILVTALLDGCIYYN